MNIKKRRKEQALDVEVRLCMSYLISGTRIANIEEIS
jgi:hypothetical protein